jgi:hypothetical protein
LTTLFAPLFGVLLYLYLIGQMANAAPTWGFLFFVLMCWFVALLLTAMLGVPIGLGMAHLLRSRHIETVWSYGSAGLLVAGSLPLLFGVYELVLPTAFTGLLLGVGYWVFEARPRLAE